MTTTQTIIPVVSGYQIGEKLYSGSKTLVYRGIREEDSVKVVIKVLAAEYPTFNELLQFRNQYTITKNLNINGIIRPYALQAYRNSYALIMEDFGGVSLHKYMHSGNNIAVAEVLSIAVQITDILHNLHKNHVIHKDIKPANILINPDTKEVKLIDFSIASLLSRETQEIKNPNGLEGTLAYLSPEQTGRMNRGIDYRTDIYSLGITLYELLTGKLPFNSNDAIELVHCHIARYAPSLKNQLENTFQVLDNIVQKLIAKNAEDRYQSALGLKHDLCFCLTQLKDTGKIENFEIGKFDICDKFIIPEKLYGRETEVEKLLASFERVATNGNSELMLVAGFSGIGKTAVINEVHKPIVKQHGYFIKGKFDQFNRNIPLWAFLQAFRHLLKQLLSESNEKLLVWKKEILKALGNDAQVIIDVIPELEKIIGKQPPIEELSGTAAQNRFNLFFLKFIQVFTTKEHPLVIFLDDLQWADSISFKLMRLLMNESKGGYLLLIGAYRHNEVFPAHPLMTTLDNVKKADAVVNIITLEPLNQSSLNQLVADTLNCNINLAEALTELIYQRTKGNPFFSTQFLKSLHEDGFINFNFDNGYWQCNLNKIKVNTLTDDVVEFMALQLQKLPQVTQDILKLAACIGNQFDLSTLAIVCRDSEVNTATNLWKALQEGLILPQSDLYKFYLGDCQQNKNSSQIENISYRFLHDRVQQAAYCLIPEEQKQAVHHQIGKLLLRSISPEGLKDRIFQLTNQLNHGIYIINQQTERDELAQLNLNACRRAKSTIAYQAGLKYCKIGLSLLGENSWQRQYEMSLAFHELGAELASLCGEFDEMERFIEIAIAQASSLIEKVNVYRIRILSNVSQNKLTEALDIAKNILEQLGITFPEATLEEDIQQTITVITKFIGNRDIEDLVDLPRMSDAEKIAIVDITNSIIPAVYISNPHLFPFVVSLSVKLSIQYGNTPASVLAYACYGLICCNLKQDMNAGVKFGKLALELAFILNIKGVKSDILNVMGLFLLHRKSHIKETLPLLQEGYISGLETGNHEFAGYSAHSFCLNSFWSGQPLTNLEQETNNYCKALVQLNQLTAANWCRIYWQPILNLLEITESPSILSGEALQEAEFLPQLLEANDLLGLYLFYLYKLMLCYLFGEIETAQNHAIQVERYSVGAMGTVGIPAFYFYDSLSVLASLSSSLDEKSQLLERVERNQTELQQNWSHYAPMNHQHKYDLVEAERCRVQGKKTDAMELYDLSIAGAKQNDYIQEEALANEVAAKFYLDWDRTKIAATYMQEAYYCYAKWGAKAKTDYLEKHYPQLLEPILQQKQLTLNPLETITNLTSSLKSTSTQSQSSSSTTISNFLDFNCVLQAAQTISGSIEFDELITNLTKIILENSGAKKVVLILPQQDNNWEVKSVTYISKEEVIQGKIETIIFSESINQSKYIPKKLINYVKNTQETILINNTKTDIPGLICEYMLEHKPKSLLCNPIIKQGHTIGILYLENKLTSGVFTKERLQIIKLLSSQAAISLENARLYSNLQDSEARFLRLAENAPGMIYQFQLSPEGVAKLNYVSSGCYEIYEISPEEAVAEAKKIMSMTHPEDMADYETSILISAQTIEAWEYQGRIITPSGKLKWIQAASRPIKQSDGTIIWDGLLIEITERKKAEIAVKEKSQELEKVLEDLQQAQLQIVQNEKMSALGNLVAGVAHEMNNPLGFISATLKQTKPTFADITEHLELYQENYPNPVEEITEHAEEIDLEYTLKDLPKMIDGMLMASHRLKNISTSLRTFSRADQNYKVSFNIHEGLDSTILILKHRLKGNEKRPAIEVIQEYGHLPSIQCFPGQLNQVFMNVLANAIDALDESNTGYSFEDIKENPNKIIVKTSADNDRVQISIIDNAKGMTEEVKRKIFEHLFTTKNVGKGTGLGLAITRQIIVEKHQGTIDVNSEIGKGSEFIISLPVGN